MARRKLGFGAPRLTFGSFACFLLGLALLALGPIAFFHWSWKGQRLDECAWIRRPPLVCAHGGDSSEAPPNTFAAFQRALAAGSDCIEMDASLTADGVLVVLHSRELQSMTNSSNLQVGDLTFDQIQQLDAGFGFSEIFGGQRVPSLHSALKYVSRSLKQVIIDVKVGPPRLPDNLAAEVLSVVRGTDCGNCVVWSKVDQIVHDYKRLQPDSLAGYIVMKDTSSPELLGPTRMRRAEVAGVFHGLVNDKLVSAIHRAGKKVHAWTVNQEADMERMLQLGVDCIITSHPQRLQHVMKRIEMECSSYWM